MPLLLGLAVLVGGRVASVRLSAPTTIYKARRCAVVRFDKNAHFAIGVQSLHILWWAKWHRPLTPNYTGRPEMSYLLSELTIALSAMVRHIERSTASP